MTIWRHILPAQSGSALLVEFAVYDSDGTLHHFRVRPGEEIDIPDRLDGAVFHVIHERAARRSPDGKPTRLAIKPKE